MNTKTKKDRITLSTIISVEADKKLKEIQQYYCDELNVRLNRTQTIELIINEVYAGIRN